MFTTSLPLTPGMAPVAWVRDSAGNPVKLCRDVADDGSWHLTNGKSHLRAVRDERGDNGRRTRIPLHSVVRDVKAKDGTSALMRTHIPDAAAIVEDFGRGLFATRDDAVNAELRYVDILKTWRNDYLRSRRSDADGLFLQLETVASLGKMIEITYATPTIEDAFPISVVGTVLETARGVEKEIVEELPVFGVDVSISGLPTASIRRGERWYNFVHVKAGARILDTEIARFREIAGRYPEDFGFDLWEDRLKGAAMAVQRGVARTIAFGRPQNEVPGLFRNAAIPTLNVNFTTTTPADNLAAISSLLAAQFQAVNGRIDRQADSIALSPFAFMFLSQQVYNPSNASNVFTMEMIMRANPWIKSVYQILEAQPSVTDAAELVKHGMDATEAEINSGGIRISGTQRNAVVVYKRDANLAEIIKGFEIETTVYPPVADLTQAKVVESVGGFIAHEPKTILIGYENA